MELILFGLLVLFHQSVSTEVIYKLSKEDYARMPLKTDLDRYQHCLNQPNGVYCFAHADVVSDGPSELLDMMRGYSAYTTAHHNYTRLRRGLCMTRSCQQFYSGDSEPELRAAAEACLNHTLAQECGLKTKVTKINCYFEDETKSKYSVDWVDWAVAALIFAVLTLNVAGSVYDYTRDEAKPANRFLLSFSWKRNWKQLMQPPSPDPRAMELQSLNGIRFLTCLIIVFVHVPMPAHIALENPDFIEKGYEGKDNYLIYNANTTTQSFFLMSGLLLVYNMQISTEKQPFTWRKYMKSIFLRWTRLAPMILLSLVLSATWLRFSAYGPLWHEQTGEEVEYCRKYWIYNALFINNLVDVSTCNLQAWSSASDFHLHMIGLTVLYLAPSVAWRRVMLALLYVVGLVWPAYNVITRDLDGTLIAKPETIMEYYKNDETFHYLYKRTYSNMPVFIIGMTLGFFIYDWQKRKVTTRDHSKYRYAYWLLFPLMVLVLQSGGYCFYQPGPPRSLPLRALFTPVIKPLFGLIVALIIAGAVNKVETLYRSVLEWRGFVPLAKLSFSIYTFHMLVIRYAVGSRATLVHMSYVHVFQEYFGYMGLIVIFSVVAHLCVEAPVNHLVKMAFVDQSAPAQAPAKDNKAE
ncbi:nose resistant to fluoxetine protein 6-like isoform X1 [Ostrinia furnacalis]|uniref:nose resistant to fluoxetine protein 6-like isoform X1 n=1 Tax=Ostrinia furnacalis TaxID=93504 RepID=UPI00103FCDB7|nr:nose resistant to fluoxetine protein 6-like isoform X1 [Ostrinia furnacalis]